MLEMLLLTTVVMVTMLDNVLGGARLVDPPMRSSIWREGVVNAPVNRNDNFVNCGGFDYQWSLARGSCGACGDRLYGPFDHVYPGKHATNLKLRHMNQGDVLNVTVFADMNQMGYFQFNYCPQTEVGNYVDLGRCFSRHQLVVWETNSTRYHVGSSGGYFQLHLLLPSHLHCESCVLQWIYVTGYRTGRDLHTCRECLGCGPQETYINCADFTVHRPVSFHSLLPSSTPQAISKSPPSANPIKPNTVNPFLPVEKPLINVSASPAASNTSQPVSNYTDTQGFWSGLPTYLNHNELVSTANTAPVVTNSLHKHLAAITAQHVQGLAEQGGAGSTVDSSISGQGGAVSTVNSSASGQGVAGSTVNSSIPGQGGAGSTVNSSTFGQGGAGSNVNSSITSGGEQYNRVNIDIFNEICTPNSTTLTCTPADISVWCLTKCRHDNRCPKPACTCTCLLQDGNRYPVGPDPITIVIRSPVTKIAQPDRICYKPSPQWARTTGMTIWCRQNCPGERCHEYCSAQKCFK